jgi:hypothetical protein
MSTTFRRDLERLRHWQGQTLRSRDYRDQARFDARRRQLHNRALHSTDGVASGLGVEKIGADPLRLRVGCGVGYDCYGRELMLQRPREITAPGGDSNWLVLRHRTAPADPSCCAPPDPGCLPDSALLLDRDVELAWSPAASFEAIRGVVLARVDAGALSLTFRPRQARPMARPRLARGETVRGNTPWEPWAIDEPDGQGGLRRKVVGVQTHIDTSAAGFTQTPCYLASVDAPSWDVAKAEFAPAFFPHVADPTVDGFTFRLLMVETTRRRYAATSDIARVVTTSRGLADGLEIEVDDAGPFQKGDVIALLRPRARSLVRASAGAGDTILLSAPLEQAEVDKTVLAIGNLPRMARVTKILPQSATMVATFRATPAVKKRDVLLRSSDGAIAVIDSVSLVRKQLTVNAPFTGWNATDALSVARLSKAVRVSTATPNGATTKLDLTPASHGVNKNLIVVFVDDDGDPLGGARTVMQHSGASIDVAPPLTAAEIAQVDKVAVFTADIVIQDVKTRTPGMVLEVTSTAPFAEGDFVAAAGNTSVVTTIRQVTASTRQVELDAVIPVAMDGDLVAANWVGAATVSGVGAAGPNSVIIGRTNCVPADAFVVRRAPDDSFSPPSLVKAVNGSILTLETPIAGLARLDTLAIGAFPHVVNVLSQQADEEHIQILATQAGRLAVGDEVAPVIAGARSVPVAQVTAVNGNDVVLGNSLGALTAGQTLAVVHFRDRAVVTKVNTPTSIEIDRDVDLRDGEMIGVLTHYADNSNPGWIDRVEAGNRLVLAFPSIEAGDGIVRADWIDGGVVGFASLTYAPSDPSPQWRYQPIVRLESTEGLEHVQPGVVYGFDLLSGRFVASPVVPYLFGSGDRVVAWPTDPGGRFRYRPETLSLITTFNTDFPRAFATFAQKQQLSVSWIACQEEFPRPTGCPGRHPYDVCADPGPTEA